MKPIVSTEALIRAIKSSALAIPGTWAPGNARFKTKKYIENSPWERNHPDDCASASAYLDEDGGVMIADSHGIYATSEWACDSVPKCAALIDLLDQLENWKSGKSDETPRSWQEENNAIANAVTCIKRLIDTNAVSALAEFHGFSAVYFENQPRYAEEHSIKRFAKEGIFEECTMTTTIACVLQNGNIACAILEEATDENDESLSDEDDAFVFDVVSVHEPDLDDIEDFLAVAALNR